MPSKGVWGSAVSSPIGAWGGAPEANAFCVQKTPKTIQKSDGQEAFKIVSILFICVPAMP